MMIVLSWVDLALASLLVVGLAILSVMMQLQISQRLLIGAVRTTVQLLLIAWVLKLVFANESVWWVLLMWSFMLLAAAYEVTRRQKRSFRGWWGYSMGFSAMFLSSFVVTLMTLLLLIQADPWYHPQYAIPLLGMLLGNTMNGVALGLDRLTQSAWEKRMVIEARLMLGETWKETIADIRRESIRTGLIPIMNAMAAAGIITLPGMMTGQILAGASPWDAVKYQILIMFLIAGGTGFGTMAAVNFGAARLFDKRERLCLQRLKTTD